MSELPFMPKNRHFVEDGLEPLDEDCLSEQAIIFNAPLRLRQRCQVEDCPVRVVKDRGTGAFVLAGECPLINDGFDMGELADDDFDPSEGDISLSDLNPDEI